MTATARAESRRARRRLRREAPTRSSRARAGDDAFAAFRRLVDEDATPTSKRRWTAALRTLAGDAFVSDRGQRTLSWWAERLDGLVARKTVERWSALDGWIAKRAALQAAAREVVMREMVSDMARNFIDDLEALDRLHGALTAQLEGNNNVVDVPILTGRGELVIDESTGVPRTRRVEIAPSAYATRAEAVRALIAIDRRRDEKRSLIRGAADPGRALPPTPHTELNLSAGVARCMAHARLLAERAESELVVDDEGRSGGV